MNCYDRILEKNDQYSIIMSMRCNLPFSTNGQEIHLLVYYASYKKEWNDKRGYMSSHSVQVSYSVILSDQDHYALKRYEKQRIMFATRQESTFIAPHHLSHFLMLF